MTESILFVSVNGKSVRSSAIRAHAARKGHQKSRMNAANRELNSVNPGDSSLEPLSVTSKGKSRRKVPKTVETLNGTHHPQYAKNIEDDEAIQTEKQITKAVKRQTPSPFQVWLPQCMSDRFVSMFFETMMPSYTAAYDVFNVPNILLEEWPRYMNHEVFLWTEASAIQGLYESLQDPNKPPSSKVLQYQAEALSLLKRELLKSKDGQLDDYLVMSIFVLAALSLMAGDETTHNAHKKMLRTAFAAAGGLHNFGPFVRNTTMRLDSFWRSTANEPKEPPVPILAPTRVPRLPAHPFASELCLIIGKLPVGFQELALKDKLPIDILEVLGRIADPTQRPLPQVLACGDNRSPKSSSGQYVDFWEACPSLSATARGGEPALERLLALALLIYSTNRDSTNPLRMYNCITNGAIYDLCFDLPRCEKHRSNDEEHCLFWVWSVAVDAMRDRFGVRNAQGEKLLAQQKARFPDVVGSSLEEKVLERFWFASDTSNGSCLFSNRPLRLLHTSNIESVQIISENPNSPGGSTESMDSWSVTTPTHEREVGFGSEKGLNYRSERDSASPERFGPGFGLLPRGKMAKDLPDLNYGKTEMPREMTIRFAAA